MNRLAQSAPRTMLYDISDKLHSTDWGRMAVFYARFALGTAFLSAVASRFGLWERTVDLKHFAGFLDYAGEVLSFMPKAAVPYFAWAATGCETTLGILLILGLWQRWVALASAILLAMFGSAMAISFGLKSPMDYSVFSASAGALLLARYAFRQKNRVEPTERRAISMTPPLKFLALVTALCIVVLGATKLPAQMQNDDELLRARESVWRAWFAGDTKTLAELVPTETIVMSGGEKEWKHQPDVLRSSAEFHSKGGRLLRLEFSRTEVQHFGDVAVIWSSYFLETEVEGKRSSGASRVTEIFVRQHGRWTNPGWHTDEEK